MNGKKNLEIFNPIIDLELFRCNILLASIEAI